MIIVMVLKYTQQMVLSATQSYPWVKPTPAATFGSRGGGCVGSGFFQALLTNTTLTGKLAGGNSSAPSAYDAAVSLAASLGLNDKALQALLADSRVITAAVVSASTTVRHVVEMPADRNLLPRYAHVFDPFIYNHSETPLC